ncbi:hypothetical protein J6590_015543 [Homalodisca vitripennis]|nr:hypothetical protein J6590_015543 [Homalodisca vitripennis]
MAAHLFRVTPTTTQEARCGLIELRGSIENHSVETLGSLSVNPSALRQSVGRPVGFATISRSTRRLCDNE